MITRVVSKPTYMVGPEALLFVLTHHKPQYLMAALLRPPP